MSGRVNTSKPKLTVVVSPREGHSQTLASLRSVLADDALPFALIYVDILSPPKIAAALRDEAAERGFMLIRHDAWIAPAAARKQALAHVETPFVAFIDNDAFVEPGCFARLVACAEETGAGLVGPLYLQGAASGPTSIHMAGGVLERDDAGRLISEHHGQTSGSLAYAETLGRQEVDYIEYHCVLARTELARAEGVISDEVLLVHEHIDLSLAIRERGFKVWMEPAARINYAAADNGRLGDLAFFLRRWDEAACEESLEAFCRRWPVGDRQGFLGPAREFVGYHKRPAISFHARAGRHGLDLPMQPAELAQTRTALREQAGARGYDAGQLKALELACDFATLSFNGTYRPDGRPFLNHAIGTASALIRYDLRHEVVLAGLLHAAYTHRPDFIDPAEVTRLLASGHGVEPIVRALPWAKQLLARGGVAEELTVTEGWALAVEAANETDMLLSGEYRACGRKREIEATGQHLLADALALIGVPGLAASAAGAPGEGSQTPIFGISPMHASFRLDSRTRRVDPVALQPPPQ